ncbi:MAG: helix-hairpin-helix domain-containing protein [Bacteroidetes bacterium]|nr:helix-hairpin-helix domain-containing protein [Bacteroidota bacterium]MBL7103934.1 helix-hairpin-helix domain-containing protein [Bacteroidales bacterium]
MLFHYKRIILVIFTLILSVFSIAQEPESPIKTDETDISDKIENIAESTETILDYTELIEDLKYYREHPLNLNYATEEDLRKLIFLNNIQIFNLLAYRETYGNFITIYELQGVDGFDYETIQKILPYVKVGREKPKVSISLKKIAKYMRNDVFIRYQRIIQEQKGYSAIDDSLLYENPNSRYMGSPDKIYFRYGFNYFNRIRFGITAEKDAGEVFLKNNVNDSIRNLVGTKLKNGFDFYSIHFSLKDIGHLKALTIGDYQLQFGQGLTLWSGLAFGKSSDAIDIKKFAVGVKPYTSTDENGFFRGIASTIGIKNFDISAFYSSHKIDANLGEIDTLTDETPYITSLQESGLHRTPNELLYKKAVNLMVFGGNVTYKNKRLKLGLTAYKSKLEKELLKDFFPYNQFNFNGTEIIDAGIDYSYLFNKLNIFGEVSVSQNGGWAQLHGFTANPHPRLFLTVLYRNYQKNYYNFFSNAFAEGSYNHNEKGFYTGIRLNLHSKWILTAYIDNFSFPWLKYRVDAPSRGNEFLVQTDYSLSKNVFMYFRFRQKNKQINYPNEEQFIESIVNTRKNYFRFHIEYSISPSVVMKNRLEYVIFKEGNFNKGTGYLIYHDIAWKPPSGKLSVIFRYSLFDTDSYDERIYAYENDVLYAFSVPAYYYKGSRGYILLKYQLTRKINFWLRFAHTYINNRQTFGTALDEINGNTKSEVKVQLRIKF